MNKKEHLQQLELSQQICEMAAQYYYWKVFSNGKGEKFSSEPYLELLERSELCYAAAGWYRRRIEESCCRQIYCWFIAPLVAVMLLVFGFLGFAYVRMHYGI